MASRLASVISITLSIVLGLVDLSAAASETDAQTPDPTQTLTLAQRERLSEFMQILPVGEAKSVKIAGTEYPRNARPYILLAVNQGFPGEYAHIEVDAEDGTIYHYTDMQDWTKEQGLEGKTIRDAISAEEAFASALPILRYYGLATTFDEYGVRLLNLGTTKSGEIPLDNVYWGVKKEFSYERVPCSGSQIVILISPLSGKLLMLDYDPPIVPHAPTRTIAKAEAIENARNWLEVNKYISPSNPVVDSGALDEIKYVIALPNDFGIPVHEAEPEEGPVKSFYCWEVPFYYTQDDNTFEARIWVNVETGQVIGGR